MGLLTTENLLQLRGPLWHFEISEVYLSEVNALYYSRSKSSLDCPPAGYMIIQDYEILIKFFLFFLFFISSQADYIVGLCIGIESPEAKLVT